MNKITIKTIVPDAKCGSSTSSALTVNNISNLMNTNDDIIRDFSPDDLIKSNRLRREKLADIYNKYYADCIEKIKLLDDLGKTDLVYEIPNYRKEQAGNVDYVVKHCMDYIERELQFKYLNTSRMNYRTLFITWKYVEFNKDKRDRKK